eukprot:Selendium_serpulae@DN3191_c0_g1_i11.p1
MGNSDLQLRDVYRVLDELRVQFPGDSYDIIDNNCNDFSDALCKRLVGRGLPAYVNRLAYWSRCCRCLFPAGVGRQDGRPPQPSGGGSRSAVSAQSTQQFQGRGNRLGGSGPPDQRPLLTQAATVRSQHSSQ